MQTSLPGHSAIFSGWGIMKRRSGHLCLGIVTFVCLAAGSVEEASAQTYYIRPPGGNYGSENGSSWTNAYDGWPSTTAFDRGAVYYVADGTYPGYTFKKPASGAETITIKKATVADHGTDSGWTASMGDGEAFITSNLSFTTPYWVFDGQVRNPDWKSGYGFRIDATAAKGVTFADGANFVTLRHTEIFGRGQDGAGSPSNDLIYMNAEAHSFKIQKCYLHDSGRTLMLMRRGDDGIVEDCYMCRNESTAAQHAAGISSDINTHRWTIRNNIWEDVDGTGIIAFSGDDWKIYGNLCFETGDPDYGTHGNGAFCSWGGYTVNNAKLYNNTFVNITGHAGFYFDPNYCTGNLAINNLWYSCETVNWNGIAHDYNAYYASGTPSEPHGQYSSLNPFVSVTNHDYRLAVSTTPGDSSIGSEYNTDLFGNIRGGDGSWDRGAVEHVLDQPLPTYTPAPPTKTPTNTVIPPSPTITDTPTLTNTPGPATNTPTPTNTSPPPTPTNTLMDVGNSPVGMWGFDEGSGAMARDDSGFGNDGQLNGDPTWIQNPVNGVLDLDGEDDYINCGNSPSLRQLSDSFSISLHLKAIGRGQSDFLLDKNGNDVGFYLRTQPDDSLVFKLDDGSDEVYLTSNNSNPLDGVWHHVAVVVNARTSAKLYVDGVVQTGGSGFLPSIGSLVNEVNLAIGAKTVFALSSFRGCLDSVAIYNKALSDGEIVAIRDAWISPDSAAPINTPTLVPPSPTPSPTKTATASPSPSPTATHTATVTPSRTPTNTSVPPTATHTSVPPTATHTPAPPTATPTPTSTPTDEAGTGSPPPAVDDLRAESRYLPGRYKIIFTTPDGEPDTDGMQAGTSYDIRYSLTPMETLDDFLYGQRTPYDRSPLGGGTLKGIIFENLPNGPNHFALRTKGPGGWSAPSNSAWASLYDIAPPENRQSKAYSNHMIFGGGEDGADTRELVLRGSNSSWNWDDPLHRDNSTSIEIRAFGERLLSSPAWGEGWRFQNSEAHNVILVDDPEEGPQNEWMAAGPSRSTIAAIRAHLVTPRFDYGLLSTHLGSPNDVGAYSSKVQLDRHVAFPDHKFFVVFDDVKSADGLSHNYGWVGHGFGTLDLSVPKTARFTKSTGHGLAMGFLAPSVALWNYSLPSSAEGETVQAPYVIAKTAGQDVQFLTVLAPVESGETAPTFSTIEVGSGSAGRVGAGDAEYLVFCQKGREGVTVDGNLNTNAKFAVAKVVDGEPEYVFVLDQSGWLRWGDKKLFNPGRKRSFLYQSDDPTVNGPSVTTVVD
jgi:hypothetical protein